MAWDGSGQFSRTNGTNSGIDTWADDASSVGTILSDRHDTHDQDLADGINSCLTKNNESKPTAHFLPNADSTYNLGSGVARWKVGYFDEVSNAGYANISALLSATKTSGAFTVRGYHSEGDGGGGRFYWDASGDKALHDGGLYIDPDIVFPSDWDNETQKQTWFTAGTGTGIFKRILSGDIYVEDFGAKGSGNDTLSFQYCLNATPTDGWILSESGQSYTVTTLTRSTSVNIDLKNSELKSTTGTPLTISPSSTEYTSLTTNVTAGDNTVSESLFAAATVGCTILFKSDTVRQTSSTDYKYGQFVKVVRISGGLIEFYPHIAESFQINDAVVYEPLDNVTIKNAVIDIRGAPTSTIGISCIGSDLKVKNVSIEGDKNQHTYLPSGDTSQNMGVLLQGVDLLAENIHTKNIRNIGTTNGYGVALYGSNCTIRGGNSYGCRHATDSGDRGFMSLNVKILGVEAEKDSTIPTWGYAVGVHANVIGLVINGTTTTGNGALLGIRCGQGSITGNTLNQNESSTYATGSANITIQERSISKLNITGNNFIGEDYTCIEIYNNQVDNAGLNTSGNSYGTKELLRIGNTVDSGSGDSDLTTTAYIEPDFIYKTEKARLIESIYSIVTPSNVMGLWIFDKYGAATTVGDYSTFGGATAHTLTLRDENLTAKAASAFPKHYHGVGKGMRMGATRMWSVDDSNDFSFGNGTTDSAFSTLSLISFTNMDNQVILAKNSTVGGSTQKEYSMVIFNSKVYLQCYDDSTAGYIGRQTSALTDSGEPHCYITTKSTGTTSSAIKIYRDGVAVDSGDSASGSYTAMENKTSPLSSYLSTDGVLDAASTAKPYHTSMVTAIFAEELTAVQVSRLSNIMRSYAGED